MVRRTQIEQDSPTNRLRGIAWMGAACLLWTVVEVLGRVVPRGYSAYQTVWMRYATHLLVMAIGLGPRYGLGLVRTRRPVLQACRSLLMLGMPVFFIAAAARMPRTEVWSVFWMSPLVVAGMSRWCLGERLRLRHWVVPIGGLGGVLLILGGGADALRGAAVLPLGMALCFSAYQVMTRAMRDEPTVVNLFHTALFVLIPLTLALPRFWRPLTPRAAATMAAIGLIGLLGLFALDRALHLAPASVVGPLAHVQAVFGLVADWAVFGHAAGGAQILGSAVVLASGLYVSLREWRATEPARVCARRGKPGWARGSVGHVGLLGRGGDNRS